ncbi:MAG: hypothetical protein AB7G62_02855 [Magnetospirillum sp.]
MTEQALDYARLRATLAAIEDPVELMEESYAALTQLLRRTDERPLLDQLSIMLGEVVGDLPFDAPEQELRQQTRLAAVDCLTILEAAGEKRQPRLLSDPQARQQAAEHLSELRQPSEQTPQSRHEDLEYSLPPQLAHLLKHIEYLEPEPPAGKSYTNFDALCLGALQGRMERVLAFFQKTNPAVNRPLSPPFLMSPMFAQRLKDAVAQLIYPKIRASRQIRLLASNIDVATTTTESFWEQINDSMGRLLELTWQAAWNDLLLIAEMRGDERVWKVKAETKALRDMLAPPHAQSYDLPHVGNAEIILFQSLLSVEQDWWPLLSEFWRACHSLYEQEWDPRVFQQQAREGALRDMLLKSLADFPEPWQDFIVLMAHRVFPRLGIRFLDRFAYNLGTSEESRRQRMPVLMRYIDLAHAHSGMREQEERDEEQWRSQVKALSNYLKGVSFATGASAG